MLVRQIFLVFCEAVFAIAAVVVHVADVVHVDATDAIGSRAQNSIQFLACEGEIVVATVSYNVGSCHCDHVLEEVWWWKEIGYELADGDDVDNLVVHAWCDLEPYGGD